MLSFLRKSFDGPKKPAPQQGPAGTPSGTSPTGGVDQSHSHSPSPSHEPRGVTFSPDPQIQHHDTSSASAPGSHHHHHDQHVHNHAEETAARPGQVMLTNTSEFGFSLDPEFEASIRETLAIAELPREEQTALLLDAVSSLDMDRVRRVLEAGADVNGSSEDIGATALMFAVDAGDSNLVKYLIARGARVAITTRRQETALHVAGGRGRKDAMRYLVAQGCPVDAQDVDGNTALHLAASMGFEDCVKFLLDCGAHVDMKNIEGNTSIHYSARLGHIDTLKRIIGRRGNVNAQNRQGDTPLHYAASSGEAECVRYLLRHGARMDIPNKDGDVAEAVIVNDVQGSVLEVFRTPALRERSPSTDSLPLSPRSASRLSQSPAPLASPRLSNASPPTSFDFSPSKASPLRESTLYTPAHSLQPPQQQQQQQQYIASTPPVGGGGGGSGQGGSPRLKPQQGGLSSQTRPSPLVTSPSVLSPNGGAGAVSPRLTNVTELSQFLEQLGLSNYRTKFEEEQIDLLALSVMSEKDLQDLGLPLGPRKKLLVFAKKCVEENSLG